MSEENEMQLLHLAEEAIRAGNPAYAKKILQEIVQKNKFHGRANELLAYAIGGEGNLDGAIELLAKVVESPNSGFHAPYELGSLYLQKAQFRHAIDFFRKSLTRGGNFFELFHDFALALGGASQPREAMVMIKKAIEINPRSPEAHYNLGRLYDELKDYEKSLIAYESSILYNHNFFQAHINHGVALYELNRPKEALISYKKALDIEPRSLDALLNQGMAYHALNKYQDALNSYDAALLLDAKFAPAVWNKSLVQLTLANFDEGWKNYEERFNAVKANQRRFEDIPTLLGAEQMRGARVLVWCEQGYGDALQFCRYIPLMRAAGANIIFLVPGPLEGLMQSLGSCKVIVDGEKIEAVDYQIPLLSLPKLFSCNGVTVPNKVPYLKAPQQYSDRIGVLINGRSDKKLRVGVAFSGSPAHVNDSRRSMLLAKFLPLLALGHIYLIQKGMSAADRKFLNDHPEIIYCGDYIHDFQDSAALVSQMDVIVTVDTSLAHLAGALNQKTFLCLPYSPEWRWQSERSDSPWYPSVRLFRQVTPGDWNSVIENIGQALKQVIAH